LGFLLIVLSAVPCRITVSARGLGSSGGGQGIFTSQDGDAVTWKAYFFGKVEKGKIRSFGIVKFWVASQKLAWMNKTIAAAEGTADLKTMEMNGTGYE
jgi:hypothetical protein